jgi:hypothetical protein
MLFGAGLACPESYSNVTARGGQTRSRPELVLVTTSLTGTVCGLFEAPPDVMVIVPL